MTKKNSAVLIGGSKHPRMLPSAAYRGWLESQLKSRGKLKAIFGDSIPFRGPVSIAAQIYRDRDVGDCTGFYDAIGDAIQSREWKCQRPTKVKKKLRTGKTVISSVCAKKMVTDQMPVKCLHCGWPMPKLVRDGLGLIANDRQIRHWDGSRLKVDPLNPRIEIVIATIDEAQMTLEGL